MTKCVTRFYGMTLFVSHIPNGESLGTDSMLGRALFALSLQGVELATYQSINHFQLLYKHVTKDVVSSSVWDTSS